MCSSYTGVAFSCCNTSVFTPLNRCFPLFTKAERILYGINRTHNKRWTRNETSSAKNKICSCNMHTFHVLSKVVVKFLQNYFWCITGEFYSCCCSNDLENYYWAGIGRCRRRRRQSCRLAVWPRVHRPALRKSILPFCLRILLLRIHHRRGLRLIHYHFCS